MKSTVVTLEQGRKRIAKQKEKANRDKLAKLVQDIWNQAVLRIDQEMPDVAVVGAQFDILQLPNRWWTSAWSARLKKLHFTENGKKRAARDSDFYEEFAEFRADVAAKYHAMAQKRGK